MVECLTVALCLAALLQPTRDRFHLSMLYACGCAIHYVFFNNVDGAWYYLSDGIINLIVLCFVSVVARPSWFSDCAAFATVAGILTSLYGWTIYESYMEPTSYNVAFHILYLSVIIVMLRKDGVHDTCYLNRLGVFRWLNHSRDSACRALRQEAEL